MLGLKSPKSYMQTFNIFKIILFLIARGGVSICIIGLWRPKGGTEIQQVTQHKCW